MISSQHCYDASSAVCVGGWSGFRELRAKSSGLAFQARTNLDSDRRQME